MVEREQAQGHNDLNVTLSQLELFMQFTRWMPVGIKFYEAFDENLFTQDSQYRYLKKLRDKTEK